MNQNPLGLDIGGSTMKAVWLLPQKQGYQLLAALTTATPVKGMFSESPLDQEEMAQAIRRIVSEGKNKTQSVNIALPENQVYTKVLEMPLLSDKELASAIYWEAEQYIPVPLTNITIDWKVLKRPEKPDLNAKMDVLLVGAPTLLIDKYQKILTMAGLTIEAVETELLSAARSIVTEPTSPNTLIVNIGAASTSLAIIRDGTMVFTYSVATGGAAISRAIAADFGFTQTQAEEYKKTYGISDKTFGGKIGLATSPILMSIASVIKKALAYYNGKYSNESQVRQIVLTGGSAKLPGIDLFFARNCGVETVTANPWRVLASQNVPKDILDNAPEYTVAVGLAMRPYE